MIYKVIALTRLIICISYGVIIMAIKIARDTLTYIALSTFVFFAFISFTNLLDTNLLFIINRLLYISIFSIFILNIKYFSTLKRKFAFSLLMLFLYSFFYIIKTIYHGENIIGEISTGIFYFATYCVFILAIDLFGYRKVLMPLLFSSLIIVLFSTLIFLGLEITLYNTDGDFTNDVIEFSGVNIFTGVFVNQNPFAIILLIHIILSTIYYSQANTYKYLILFSMVLSAFFLVLTMSRSVIFSLIIITILYQIRILKTKKGVFILIVSIALVVFATYYLYEYIELIRVRTEQAGTSGRTEIWADAFEKFRGNYLLGLGNYTFSSYGGVQLSAHNFYIQKLVSDGLISFIFLFLFLIHALFNVIKVYFSNRISLFEGCNKLLFAVSFVAIILHQFFEASLTSGFQPLTILLFFLIVVVLDSSYKIKN